MKFPQETGKKMYLWKGNDFEIAEIQGYAIAFSLLNLKSCWEVTEDENVKSLCDMGDEYLKFWMLCVMIWCVF